jgi:hypothetical protein
MPVSREKSLLLRDTIVMVLPLDMGFALTTELYGEKIN